jgi:hypothetical protein
MYSFPEELSWFAFKTLRGIELAIAIKTVGIELSWLAMFGGFLLISLE